MEEAAGWCLSRACPPRQPHRAPHLATHSLCSSVLLLQLLCQAGLYLRAGRQQGRVRLCVTLMLPPTGASRSSTPECIYSSQPCLRTVALPHAQC